ncbi:AMP-binding protein [Geodermatophilus sp. SYSU D00703]
MSMLFDQVLPDVLRTRAQESADRPFLRFVEGPSVTYAETYARACSIGNGLVAAGVEHGECVVIMADNSLDSICTWLGIHLAGAVEVAINPAYRGQSLTHALQNSQARTMFVEEAHLSRLAEVRDTLTHLQTVVVFGSSAVDRPALPGIDVVAFEDVLGDGGRAPDRPVRPHHIASVVYTSGTTGPSKGVMMPHAQVALFARLGVEGAAMTEDDVHFCFIPLFHVAGKFMAILGSMITGGTVVIDTRFSAETWLARVREYGATLSHVHGPLVEMLHKQPERPDDVDNPVTRIIASPFPAKIALDFERRFGLRGIETWGMTEVTVPVWQPIAEPLRLGCCGRVREEHFDLRIVDPDTDEEVESGRTGEIVVRPRAPWTIMAGYLRNPEATLQAWRNLWFHTGDLGYVDDEGYLYFVDRAKERIRRRAENISSYDIEAAALTHPQVKECAAVGVPSEFDGDDDIQLYVIPADGAELTPEALLEHLAGQLPHFMVPRYLAFVPEVARTPTGKAQKAALRTAGVADGAWDRKAAGISLRELVQR